MIQEWINGRKYLWKSQPGMRWVKISRWNFTGFILVITRQYSLQLSITLPSLSTRYLLQTKVLIETNYRLARTIAHVRAVMDESGLIPEVYMSHVRLSVATTIATFLNVTSFNLIVTNIPEEYTAAIFMVKLWEPVFTF